MRKYLTNPSVLTALASVVPLIRRTAAGKNNTKMRNLAAWAAWVGTVTAALATVREKAEKEKVKEAKRKRKANDR